MASWAPLLAPWHSNSNQTNILQMPILRTLFVSGGAAVSLFFVISGYVLTYKSLRLMRASLTHRVYPTVASSMFRRGFRLYLPGILLSFCQMLVARFGVSLPYNPEFVPEPTISGQLADWFADTNRLINPIYNFHRSLQGLVTHPKYAAVLWTIPLEFYGSFMCYILLLVSTWIPTNRMRMWLVTALSGCCMYMGSWNSFCFLAGMLLADFELGQEENINITSSTRYGIVCSITIAVAFYIAGFPTLAVGKAKLNPMPGFEILRLLTPMSLNMEDHSRFWWSISGMLFLLSVSQLPRFKRFFETNFCQYLGGISFSLYLIHEFCIVSFGLWLQQYLLRLVAIESHDVSSFAYWSACVIWFFLFTVPVLALAAQVDRWVDAPSVKFAKWLEGRCLKFYKTYIK
ncbi:acyltransferase 3 [Xylogone sp. PMI_703]|nr:acyltransferase 3 [Xylogone sp. PMI_703]